MPQIEMYANQSKVGQPMQTEMLGWAFRLNTAFCVQSRETMQASTVASNLNTVYLDLAQCVREADIQCKQQ